MKCKVCGRDNSAEARFCASCGGPLAVPEPSGTIGAVWSYGNAWGLLRKHFLMLLLMVVLLVVAQFVPYLLGFAGRSGARTGGIPDILPSLAYGDLAYGLLALGPVGYGISFACLKAARGEPPKVVDLFAAFRNWWNSILANLLTGVIVFVGSVFLVVPGIIFGCKLAFVPYLIVDRKMGAVESIKESWRMTGGYGWKIFLTGLLAIPIFMAGLICFGVGVLVAIMWVSLAFASLYYAVSRAHTEYDSQEALSRGRMATERPAGPFS